MSSLLVRHATLADAAAMAAIREASIRQLCTPDHYDDPSAITAWVGKPDKFSTLLLQGAATLIVIEADGALAGLGGVSDDVVTLNYVHPDYRFQGVSKALMHALEGRLVAAGVSLGRLNSTATALRFYQSLGWTRSGPGTPDQGIPMQKRL